MLPQQNQQFLLKAEFLSFLTKSDDNRILKETITVISSKPRCKDYNARFTTEPYTDQKCERYCRFSDSKSVIKAC